jgi:glycosyltransferase involved in cell wall biosynthesis
MWRGLRTAVVIPAFNEADRIARTVATVPAFVDFVVVVDDASTDATWQVLSTLEVPHLHRLRHHENRGVGAAICSGYGHALAHEADVMAVMAGDAQMLPADLEVLLQALVENGAGYAKGNRFLHHDAHRMPTLRRLGSGALSWLTRRTTGLRVGDCQCGYTVLRADLARELPLAQVWPRYGYPNDLLALIAHHHAPVIDAPVTPVYAGERSGLHAGHVLSIAWRILRRHGQLRRSGGGTHFAAL